MIWKGRSEEEQVPAPVEQGTSPTAPAAAPSPAPPVSPVSPAPPAASPPAAPIQGGEDYDSGQLGNRIETIIEAAERAAAGIRADAEERARRYLEESRHQAERITNSRVSEMSALTDNLIDRAREMARQSDELIAALEDTGRQMLNSTPLGAENNDKSASPETSGSEPVQAAAASSTFQPGPGPPAAPLAAQPVSPVQSVPLAPPAAQPTFEPTFTQSDESPPIPPAVEAPVQQMPATPPPPDPEAPTALHGGAQQPDGQVSEGARLLATQMAVAGSGRDEIARRLQTEFGIYDPTAILDEIGI